MPTAPFVPAVHIVTRLRDFARRLAKHPLVEVIEYRVGRRVPDERLLRYRRRVPESLLALYAAMDGFTFEWKFRDDPRSFREGNGGRFYLPNLGRNRRTFADTFALEVEIHPFVVDFGPWERNCAVTSIVQENGDVLLYDGDYLQELGAGIGFYIKEAVEHCFTADWLLHHWEWTTCAPPSFGYEARARLGLGAEE